MSYLRAEDILPRELIDTIQQYINGKAIYIPSKDRKPWGSHTDTRGYLCRRNKEIYTDHLQGMPTAEIALKYSLSVKSIQRIIRDCKSAGISEKSKA